MGPCSTLLKQCAALIALGAIIIWAAPAEARPWCALAAGAGLAFFAAISLWRHRQIAHLSAQVDEVLHSGRTVRFEKCREGDVAVLANELEKMVARLVRTTEQLGAERNALADSLADISHQIRTPLTAAELMLPAIERMDDPAQRRRAVRDLEEMLERTAWLVTTLLKIAKADAGAIRAQAAHVGAAAVVERARAPLEAAFDLRDVRLVADLQEDAAFTGDEMWTAEALENILKDCLEHTPAGGTVRIRAAEDALACTFTITDTGPGIPEEDLPHIFERFYRGAAKGTGLIAGSPESPPDPNRKPGNLRPAPSPLQPGFGIGLALAQALISVQGGTIRADNLPEGGARFRVAFPKLTV